MHAPTIATQSRSRKTDLDCLPVLIGADVEVSNFIVNPMGSGRTCGQAARMLLAAVDGFPKGQQWYGLHGDLGRTTYYSKGDEDPYDGDSYGWKGAQGSYDPRDRGRKFTPAGTCYYIDLDHLEACLAEVRSARDFVVAWHAAMRVVEQARQAATVTMSPRLDKLAVLFNNSDGLGNSFGSHLNFLIPRRTWDDVFCHKSLFLPFLASFQISSMVITGQGKVGAENGAPEVEYQLSQRADFLETLRGEQTTYQRPIVNARDEPLCGLRYGAKETSPAAEMARLHVISYDSNLCQITCLLKVGLMQIILAMLQRGRAPADLVLDDPVAAAVRISHDPELNARVPTVCSQQLTAVELQLKFLEEARAFVAAGGCDGIVPGADELLAIWEDTLTKLEGRDWDALKSRLDWVLKRTLIEQAIARHPGMSWDSPQAHLLDRLYSSSDHGEGLYWACEREGLVERVVSPAEIERAMHEPPEDTRAWTRGKLLEVCGEAVEDVNWDVIRLRTSGTTYFGRYWTLDLSDPTSFTKEQTENIFKQSGSLDDLLERLSCLNDVAKPTAIVPHTTSLI